MQIFTDITQIKQCFTNACVTIGNFDGVHLGHQKLFNEVLHRARARRGGTSVAITFDPHPLSVLRPEGIQLISTMEQKLELVEQAGVDILLLIPFSKEFAKTTAEYFVDEILLGCLGIVELVVGYDYAFGKGRAGNIDFLRIEGERYGFPVTVVDAFYESGEPVSSTRIRKLITAGDVAKAATLMGRNYQIRGKVQHGVKRGGSQLGFPTANLSLNKEYLIPHFGVYVAQIIYDGHTYNGVLNVGRNPTFPENKLVAEVHIFDFNKEIYGKHIKINLLQFLRGEVSFPDIASLAKQIEADIALTKAILAEQQHGLALSYGGKFNC
ncbi:bifunctional riboflavin kinase/FAD synthetase [Desulfotalea psychrophila]|uniref:Riboflavin biosynthesis protein n=1 Tax=Desulfotalea psychrophila (strain LSv54 / DSM 12343) TaxID=177439 RepID=Q6APA1_DESPS|nr:bifunctional riboflavin kinase/FAD synthetase [Desulfotalea psychrophila]CAG35823.1 related to riboflavin kinase (FAD synthetase) [Desulfotalea psychrophila LSv54]